MKQIFRAGVFALAMTGLLLPAYPVHAANYGFADDQTVSINLTRIKTVLHLTSEQEPYWPPVEAALRAVARRQQAQAAPVGFVRRISNKVVSVVLDSVAVQRLAVAARPLIAKLDARQMQAASDMAQEMGLGPVVAALQ
jgi:hypothetical protein